MGALTPEDFPLIPIGDSVVSHARGHLFYTVDEALAADLADRLNAHEAEKMLRPATARGG